MSIESIRAREQKATEGPWRWRTCGEVFWEDYFVDLVAEDGPVADPRVGMAMGEAIGLTEVTQANADFIAHSRQDIPALLKVAEEARHEANQACISCDLPVMHGCGDCAVKILHAALAELEAME